MATTAACETLDAFHAAAARADADAYVALLADDFVFLGTDASERWERAAFEAYARARFAARNGWSYAVVERRSSVLADGVVAFDEDLRHGALGACRSTGVVVLAGAGAWKVARYGLSVPVPNEMVLDVVARIREREPRGAGARVP